MLPGPRVTHRSAVPVGTPSYNSFCIALSRGGYWFCSWTPYLDKVRNGRPDDNRLLVLQQLNMSGSPAEEEEADNVMQLVVSPRHVAASIHVPAHCMHALHEGQSRESSPPSCK